MNGVKEDPPTVIYIYETYWFSNTFIKKEILYDPKKKTASSFKLIINDLIKIKINKKQKKFTTD